MHNLTDSENVILAEIKVAKNPFPHFSSAAVFKPSLVNCIFKWLEHCQLWSFTETNFYTQYEFSLLGLDLPPTLQSLNDPFTITFLITKFETIFKKRLKVIDITAHKLIDGHRMGIHNDFIGDKETHRLVVQINPLWADKNGGYLLLFNSKDPEDVSKIVRPLNNTAIGFEISEKSFHAVSTVHKFSRYTIVYTFNEAD